MKKMAFLTVLAMWAAATSFAANTPRGTLVELHSCELYAGGCVVSSEATLDGRYLVRAWNFTDGKVNGTDLAGLQMVVLQAGRDNLAAQDTSDDQAIIYLPEKASPPQKQALIS